MFGICLFVYKRLLDVCLISIIRYDDENYL